MTLPSDPLGENQPPADWLPARGEMSALIRECDWSRTAAGLRTEWPQSLKMAVRIMLTSRFAMWMAWGAELTFFCNDAYSPTLGVKHPWALGQPADVVWAEIWPDIGPRVEAVLQTGEATWDEALQLFLERSGYPEETYHTFSYSPLSRDDGQIGGMLCVVTEVTERVIGERRLRLLRDASAILVPTGTEEEVFAAARACFEAGDRDLPFALIYLFDPDGRSARLAVAAGMPEEHPAAPAVISLSEGDRLWPAHEIRAGEGPVVLDDLSTRLPDLPSGPWDRPVDQAVVVPLARQGLERPAGFLVAGINPYRKLDPEYIGFVGLFAGQLASALGNAHAYAEERRRADALAELDRAKTAFFSNVSHEFRTPLTLMLGPLSELLAEAHVEPESRELLGTVHRNAQRLLKLVNTLLDFSRIEAGRVQAVYEPTDLPAATAELASVFRSAIEKAGMRLEVDCPPFSEPVYVDPDMWEKIVLNLISNAFKYTFAGKIRVSLRRVERAAVLQVADTGTGIPLEELPNLFNRFHRIEGARGRTQEGSGIGLALVQELARLHGGTVTAESVPGEGSTFTVSLPLGRDHLPANRIGGSRSYERTALGADPFVEEALRWLPDSAAEPAGDGEEEGTFASDEGASLPRAPLFDPAHPRPRVLLADDNADMREYLRRLLARRYEVTSVADGETALDTARKTIPDLVLTDVMMPRLDGFGLLRALREVPETATIPVIMLSARAGEEARVEGLQAGADDYLVKPFSARELLARVGGTLALAKARREAVRREEELRAETTNVLESIGDGFVALDADFRFTYVNAAAERINGTPREVLLGRNQWDVYPATIGTPLEAGYRRAMGERIPVSFENYYDPWDRWYDISVYPTPEGGIAVYFRDISEQKRSMDALREADRRKDEFLATLAHELRNPLAPLSNGLEILRLASDRPEAAARARRMMERQLHQMVRLIDDLLDLSRITRGKVELRRERIDLRTVVHASLETSRPLLEQAGHELVLTLPDEPVWVNGDPIRLSQVVANLLNNAAKYTDRDGRVQLHLQCEGPDAVLSVRDNGVGIEAAMLPHVFDMFSQVDRSLERSRGGLGIGLNIVQRLVELHEGSVTAHSAGAGRGSEFTVRLPCLNPSVLQPSPPIDTETRIASSPRSRVLVVDDNVDAAASLALMLEISGHGVATAHDGLEALRTAERFQPDVVLLDIGMPRLNGYDTCRRLRAEPWGKPLAIIALTGWGQEEDRRRSREAGFDAHLVKPVDPEALRQVLARVGDRTAAGDPSGSR